MQKISEIGDLVISRADNKRHGVVTAIPSLGKGVRRDQRTVTWADGPIVNYGLVAMRSDSGFFVSPFIPGDRVYYRDGGPTALATIVAVTEAQNIDGCFVDIEFDDGIENGEYWSTQFAKVL